MFNCELCNHQFKTQRYLSQHLNRKVKCNVVTDYKCNRCNRYFKHRKNMIDHQEKNNCVMVVIKEKNENDELKNIIKSILESNMDLESKVTFIRKYNMTLTKEELINLINSPMELIAKVSYIQSQINTKGQIINSNNTHNTNNNNITNNIQINNFGKEDTSYLTDEYFKDLILNNNVNNIYMKLTQDIYFDKNHPENRTIKIENINNKYALVFNNGKWDTILKYELREILHENNHKLLRIHTKKLKDLLDNAKKSSINVFLARTCNDDPHLDYMIDKIILLFYNGRELYEV